jgi:hypothetical protein
VGKRVVVDHEVCRGKQGGKTANYCIKRHLPIDKEIVNLSLFADDMVLYLKDPKKLHSKTPRHHKQLQQCSRIQINL